MMAPDLERLASTPWPIASWAGSPHRRGRDLAIWGRCNRTPIRNSCGSKASA